MADTEYIIEIGDEEIKFIGPSGLSDSQIEALADKHLKTAKPGQKFPPSAYVGDVQSPELGQAEGESSALGSFLRGLPKDATFNFGDELAAGINAAGLAAIPLDEALGASEGKQQAFWDNPEGFWGAVRNNMGGFKRQAEIDESQHPVASAAGRIGGVLSSLPRAGMAAAARLPMAVREAASAHPILSVMGLGAAGGAASGAGAGEEGTRAQSAAIGGLAGGALGGALAGGMELAPVVANYARTFFNKMPEKEAVRQIIKALHRDGFDVTSPAGVAKLKQTLQEFTGKPVSLADIGSATRSRAGVGLRAPSDVQQQSIDAIQSRQAGQGQRLASDVRANVAPRTDVHALDEQLVAQRAAEAEKLRSAALYEDAPSLYRGGAPFDPAHPGPSFLTPDKEAAGTYVDMHADRFGTPGVVEQFTDNLGMPADQAIVEQAARRAGIDLEQGTPASWFDTNLQDPEAIQALIGDLKSQGFDHARLPDIPYGGASREIEAVIPLDNKAMVPYTPGSVRSRMVDDPQLQQLARLPDAQKALGAALERARAERDLLAAQGKDISHLPDLENKGQNLDARTFDYLKRFLDDEVSSLFKRGDTATFKAGQAHQVKDLRNAIRERMRTAVPGYGDYLDTYKGSSEMIDSLAAGREFGALDPEKIIADQAERSTAAQELYRVGTARNLLDTIKGTRDSGNAASRVLNSDEARDQLLATGVDPNNVARLNRDVQQERVLNLLPQELAGSQTAQRSMAQADANAGADLAVPFNPASPYGWAGMIGRTILNKTSVNRNAAVNEQLLPKLLETNPKAIEGIITQLEQSGNIAQARILRRQLQERQAAAVGGSIIGSPVALPELGDY